MPTQVNANEQIHAAIETISNSSLEASQLSVGDRLVPALRSLHQNTHVSLGRYMLTLAFIIFEKFVPNIPLDPAAIQGHSTNRLQSQRSEVISQIRLYSQLEELSTGNTSNLMLDHLRQKLQEIDRRLAEHPVQREGRDIARLQAFWSEVLQFQGQVFSSSKIESLVVALERNETGAHIREHVIQGSMGSFWQRLTSAYQEFVDLSSPVVYAILLARHGLKTIATSSIPCEEDGRDVWHSLAAFPSVTGSSVLSKAGGDRISYLSTAQSLTLQLSAISHQVSLGVPGGSYIHEIDNIYSQILRLWLIDRAKEKEQEEAQQSLYKRKKTDHEPETEAEIEAREFAELFPSFEDEAVDEEAITNTDSPFLRALDASGIVSLHLAIFRDAASPQVNSLAFDNLRTKLLHALTNSESRKLPESLDLTSIQKQLALLHNTLASFNPISSSKQTFDFYHDPCVPEVKKAATVVSSYLERLAPIIEEFPDQEVLRDLQLRCQSILDLDVESPVAKVLTTIETLHLKTEDWEMYANKTNSLKDLQHRLANQIVEWRRLELSCWQKLLESQASSFADKASEWWFRLYDALVRGPLDAVVRGESESAVREYFASLIPLLNDFVKSSPLGQFYSRKNLLKSFDIYLYRLEVLYNHQEREVCQRTRHILRSIIRRFDLSSSRITKYFSDQRTSLEKEIREFIKLASWKDINVHALKQSATRTHQQLYKIVRKFRGVLRESIEGYLYAEAAGDDQFKLLDLPPVLAPATQDLPTFSSLDSPPSHLQNLERIYTRFKNIITQRVIPGTESLSASVLDEFAVTVITTSRDLSNVPIRKTDDAKERLKSAKTLLVHKRRALSDLLKELKRMGLSQNLKADMIRQQMDPCWIKDQPILEKAVGDSYPTLSRGDSYFDRLALLVPDLRGNLSNHHSDISTRDLQRGLSFVEHALNVAVDLRAQ